MISIVDKQDAVRNAGHQGVEGAVAQDTVETARLAREPARTQISRNEHMTGKNCIDLCHPTDEIWNT